MKKKQKLLFLLLTILLCINCTRKLQPKHLEIQKLLNDIESQDSYLKVDKKLLEKFENEILTLPNDSFKIGKIQKLSYIHYDLGNIDKFKTLNDLSLKFSLNISDSLKLAKTYQNLGIYYRKKNIDSSFKYFYESEKIYRVFNYNNSIYRKQYEFEHGKTLIDLGKLFRKVKDFNESEDFIVKAIKKFIASDNTSYIPLSYNTLGTIAKYQQRFNDAIKYHNLATEFATGTNKDTLYFILSNNNIGTVYKSAKEYKKSIEFYKRGLSYQRFLEKSPKYKAMLLDNLAYVKFLTKDNDQLPELFNNALEIREKIKDFAGIATNSIHLSEFYKSKNKDSLALVFAKKAEEAAYKGKDNVDILEAYQLLSVVSEPKTGLEYAQKYIALNDSLIKEERLYRDKFARIRFETDQKEQQIIKVQNQNTVYLLGMLLLLSLIGFALFFFRQRTKYLAQQNKIVQTRAAYETETRISKRLHDELGNDIFQVMLQYQNDPHDPEIVNRLNKTYNKARDISRENSEFEVDETYGEELTDMLQNYTNNGVQLILRGLDKLEWNNFSSTIKIAIYRVLQELMTNMQKHSQASLVALIFTYDTKTLTIKYSDNGVGIPAEQLTSKNGLRNTEKRIKAVNGTLIFDSEKDKGFKAEIKIPIE